VGGPQSGPESCDDEKDSSLLPVFKLAACRVDHALLAGSNNAFQRLRSPDIDRLQANSSGPNL
jgi:hypothetical protein